MKESVLKLPALWTRTLSAIVRRDLLLAIVVVVITICLGVFLGHENNGVVPVNSLPIARYSLEPHNPLSFMANWDSLNYLAISQHGYVQDQTNFFPLYPIAIHIVSRIISSPLYSALLIAWAGFVGAVFFFLKIIKHLYKTKDNLEASKGVLLFVLYPAGVFLFAPYTEGMFAFFALGAVYFLLKKKYIPTALFTMLATATHITGLFLLALIGLMMIEEKTKFTKIIATLAVGSLGLIGYMIFLTVHFHKPLAFITSQENHGWLKASYSGLPAELSLINLLIIILLIISVFYWWNRRKSFSIYSLLFLLIPIVGGQLGGFNRYTLMAFPVQFMLYERFRGKALSYALVIAIFSILWAHYLFQYAGGYIGG
jgi:Gpi18-like mannosyltransferase